MSREAVSFAADCMHGHTACYPAIISEFGFAVGIYAAESGCNKVYDISMNGKILLTIGALVFVVTGVVLFIYRSDSINIESVGTNEPAGSQRADDAQEAEGGMSKEPPAASGIIQQKSYINTDALEVVASNMMNAELPTDKEYWGVEDNLLPKFARKLNAIFAGDEEVLRATFNEQARCSRNDYQSVEDVQRGVAKIREEAIERMPRRGTDNPERLERRISAVERRVGTMEIRALRQVEDCLWRHQSAAQKLRAQVAAQAQAGDVMARYVYATMLSPSPYEENFPEEHAAWASNALRFSEQNVMESWTLGFEAMELSANWGWFTPVSQAMGQAWGIVLVTCPIIGPAPIGSDWNTRFRGMVDFSNSAPIHAARLIEQHCPDASSIYTPPNVVSIDRVGR